MSNINTNPKAIFEEEILHSLIQSNEYFSSVVPYLQDKYFGEIGNSKVFEVIKEYYVNTGNKPNTKDIILLIKDLPAKEKNIAVESLKKILQAPEHVNSDLLLEKTEYFIKKAIHTESLILGAEGMGSNDEAKLAESFRISEEAQKVSLDDDFGTSISNIDECIEYYQDSTMGLKLDIPSFDDMIGRGFREKTLHTVLAPPGIGKSATLAAFASQFLKQGKDIVIFTLEMDEAEWMKRIYSNVLDIPIYDLETENPMIIKRKWDEIKGSLGTLTIKEYPSYSVSAMQIQNFLEKYKTKTGIKDPVVFVDYLGLMNSGRLAANSQSYEYVKSITAELRAVAQKLIITIFTAHQLNRSAVNNLEAGQESVSDSAGISMFSDSMIFLLQTKEMKVLGEIMVNWEKNRMTGKTYSYKIGFDYIKMRFEDKFHQASTYIPEKPDTRIDTGMELPQQDFLVL